MTSSDTTLGGRDATFPETAWSSVLSSSNPSSPARRAALDSLFARYWRPIYEFVRVCRGKPVEEAKDLTQGFFCHLLEHDFVSQYDPGLGRFRHFLKGALRLYLAREHRDQTREKRGGGKAMFSLDVELPGADRGPADARQETPEEAFDREWRRDLMDQSIAELERTLRSRNREQTFLAYRAYVLDPVGEDPPGYDAVARQLGIPVTLLAHHLHDARELLQQILRARIAEYAAGREEVDRELRELFPG